MQKSSKKQPYKKPKVTSYGKISELTAGGVGSLMEGAMMTAMARKP